MHTLKIIGLGMALLVGCLALGKLTGLPRGLAIAGITFIPLWFIGAGVNMYLGVKKAGYSVADELPIFCLVFAVPALAALAVWFTSRR